MTKPLNVGMAGYGFMATAHSNAWRHVANFFSELQHRPVLRAVAARIADKMSAFANVWGYDSVETAWRRLIARDHIDLVDVCVPNHIHPTTFIRRSRSLRPRPADGSPARSRSPWTPPRARRWSPRLSGRACPTWSGATTRACPRSRSPGS